jgi:GNAT superfamily N-acetyltransferase
MDSVIVRPGEMKDLDAIWAMCLIVKRQLAADHIPIWQEDYYPTREGFAEDIKSGGLLTAWQGGRLIGSISYNSDMIGEYFFDMPAEKAEASARAMLAQCGATLENVMSAHRLMVLPDARHSGAAAALLKEVERRCRSQWIVFFAAPFNAPALRLYQKLGYRDIGEYDFSFGAMRYLVKAPAKA